MKMRLYPQIYPENSFLEPENHVSSMPERTQSPAPATAKLVRSNIPNDGLSENGIDFAAVEAQARAARSAWVGSKLKSFYESLVRKFERAGAAERENYLAASQCLAELEERIRIEERMADAELLNPHGAAPPLRTQHKESEMKTMTDKDKSSGYTRLDSIRISELDRRHANASLRDGELIAELLLRAVADLRAIARYLEHAAIGLVHGIRTMLAKPVKH